MYLEEKSFKTKLTAVSVPPGKKKFSVKALTLGRRKSFITTKIK